MSRWSSATSSTCGSIAPRFGASTQLSLTIPGLAAVLRRLADDAGGEEVRIALALCELDPDKQQPAVLQFDRRPLGMADVLVVCLRDRDDHRLRGQRRKTEHRDEGGGKHA